MKLIVAFLLIMVSCGRAGEQDPTEWPRPAELDSLYQTTKQDLEVSAGVGGWPSDKDCDSLLWAGIAAAAGADVDLSLAMQPDGRLTRKPSQDCKVPEESRSQISQDMITGFILGSLAHKDLDALEVVYQYGKDHDWVMGEGLVDRTFMRPSLRGILARAINSLDGDKHQEVNVPNVPLPVYADYEKHIRLIGQLIDAENTKESIVDLAFLGNPDITDALHLAMSCKYVKNISHCETAWNLVKLDSYHPSYVRGSDNYIVVHKLLVLRVLKAEPLVER